MKKKILILWFILLALVIIGACAGTGQPPKDPFLTNSYRALSAMDTAYDASWGAFVKLYKDGLVKEETFQAGRKYALAYFERWTKAADYLKQYAKGEIGQGGFEDLRKAADAALEEMKKYLKEKGGIKPIL